MKRTPIIHTTALFLLLGIGFPADARQEKPEKQEEKAKPGKPEQQAKPERQKQDTSAKPEERQQAKGQQEQQTPQWDNSAKQQRQDNSAKQRAFPRCSHSRDWGYFPTGGVGLVLAVVVVLVFLGDI